MADLIVREFGTDAEVSRVDVSGKSERAVERVMMGMLRNMNTEKFYIDDSKALPVGADRDR